MKHYIILILLALVTMTLAVLEGLVALPQQYVQFNGLMTIICTASLLVWTLRVQTEES